MNGSSTSVDARLSQDEVQDVYNRIAWFYDLWGTLTESHARQRGIALAGIQDGERVLEVAVGTGLMMAEVVRRNPNGLNVGIDISEGMLRKARVRVKHITGNVELKQGSAYTIPYPTGTFDLLINGYMFDLMPFAAIPQILAEFKRVLKPGGRLVLTNMTEGEQWGSRFYEWLYRQWPALMGGCRGVMLAGPLEQAGYQVMVREYQQQFLFPSEIILAKTS
jgi:ubiquinone/menaquinone biosynthesis C-methylase UbiE